VVEPASLRERVAAEMAAARQRSGQ